MADIQRNMDKLKQNTIRAKDNVMKLASEEQEKINLLLETVDEKIKTRRSRHTDFLGTISDVAKKRNTNRSERLSSHRSIEVNKELERHKKHEETEKKTNLRLRSIYK